MEDGRLFVKRAKSNYDVVMVDLPDPTTSVINRYYTVEFMKEVSQLLGKEGILITTVKSIPNIIGEMWLDRNSTIYHTIRGIYKNVLITPGDHSFIFASNSEEQIIHDPGILKRRFINRGIEAEGFSEWYFHSLLQKLWKSKKCASTTARRV
jgi:spermidine synthase